MTITDNDIAPPIGALGFSNASANVAEAAGSIQIVVARTGGSSGAVSVQYSTAAGTASAGTDFGSTSGVLTWAAGDSADKAITVSISNDSTDEPDETFTVALSAPTGGASLGTAVTTLTITDDDPAPSTGGDSGGGGGGGGAIDMSLLLLGALVLASRRLRRRVARVPTR